MSKKQELKSGRTAGSMDSFVGRFVPISEVPDDVTELHRMMHGGEPDFTWAWTPEPRRPDCYFRPPTWSHDEDVMPIRIKIGLRSQKWRWFWVYPPNVRDERPPLASGEAPAREADKQEACQKSRRDGGSLDRIVRIFDFMDKTKVKSALEAARHELTTLHGLVAADGAAPNETWTLDESEIIRQLDEAIESVDTDSHPS